MQLFLGVVHVELDRKLVFVDRRVSLVLLVLDFLLNLQLFETLKLVQLVHLLVLHHRLVVGIVHARRDLTSIDQKLIFIVVDLFPLRRVLGASDHGRRLLVWSKLIILRIVV